MSTHEKKTTRAPISNLRANKSPIATPPRVALHGRSKTDRDAQQVTSVSNSAKLGIGSAGGGRVAGTDVTSTSPASEVDDGASTASSSTSQSSTLLEKNGQIANLTRELSIMKDEFSTSLTSLSHKLAAETSTLQYWQNKYSHLNATFQHKDASYRLLREEFPGSVEAREEPERDMETRISSLLLDRDAFREAYNEAMGEVREKEEQVRLLQGQVRGLKSWVSSSSKSGEQVSDEVFGEEMRRLGNGLQNWVITNFRRVRIGKFCSSPSRSLG
ncbi:uncharacterized protein RCO7_01011 [Rhynchosporium graminicola]|uniref:Uncharacterized protein n=1 Tax=Rhynchosporium graminicola TaxID=2792576 RepID=A0A1E1JQX1_9HELO|nr:uncharacterized protein RCO7_01011 [Rhynchosporium commune]